MSGRIVPAGSGWVQFEVTQPCPDEDLSEERLAYVRKTVPVVIWVRPFVGRHWSCGDHMHLVASVDAKRYAYQNRTNADCFVCEHMGRFVE